MSHGDRRVYIGLGSNLQDPQRQVLNALDVLADLPETVFELASSLYQSRPMGPQDQPDFINAVARLDTGLSAEALMDSLHRIEARQGRIRRARWGPRTLDLDLLLYGDSVIETPRLSVPHPRLVERAFVLLPLLELDSGLVIPGHGPAADLLAAISSDGVMRMGAEPDID